jgi:hypothetical protein
MRQERFSFMPDAPSFPAEHRERGAPDKRRRQPRAPKGEGARFSHSVMSALDGATFAAVEGEGHEWPKLGFDGQQRRFRQQ